MIINLLTFALSYQAGISCDDSITQILVVVVVLHRSVTDKNISKLVVIVITGIADAFLVFLVEVISVVEPAVHVVGDVFQPILCLILLTPAPQLSP